MIRYVYWHWNSIYVFERFWKNLGLKLMVVGDKISGTAQTTVMCIFFNTNAILLFNFFS